MGCELRDIHARGFGNDRGLFPSLWDVQRILVRVRGPSHDLCRDLSPCPVRWASHAHDCVNASFSYPDLSTSNALQVTRFTLELGSNRVKNGVLPLRDP